MGFGPCEVKAYRFVKRPKDAPPLSQQVIDNHVYCDMFRWSAASAVIKTACLALFFVVESPRRVIAYAARRPEPKPLFLDCSPFGYRKCACGYHYYQHRNISDMMAEQEKKPAAKPLLVPSGATPGAGGARPIQESNKLPLPRTPVPAPRDLPRLSDNPDVVILRDQDGKTNEEVVIPGRRKLFGIF